MKSPIFLHAAIGLFVFAFTPDSRASLILWNGDTSSAWSDGANWIGGSAPANTTTSDQAGFVFSVPPTFEPNSGSRNVNGLLIGDGATAVPSFTISGTDLTLGNGGILKNAATSNTTLSPDISLAADQNWTNASATALVLSGTINNAGFNLTIDGSGFTRVSESIEGSGDLIKDGAGTLLLEGSSTFTGTTFINGGTVSIRAVENLGQRGTGRSLAFDNGGALQATGNLSFETRNFQLGTPDADGIAGTFNVADGTTSQLKGAVTGGVGTGALNKTGGGILALEASNSHTGGTIISAGTLRAGLGGEKATLGADSSSLAFHGTGATLQLEGTLLDSARSYIFEQTGIIDTNGFDLLLGGGVTGDGGLVKIGDGTLTLNSTGSHGSGTTIRSGTLTLAASGSITDPDGDLIVGDIDGDNATLLVSGGSIDTNWSILGYDIGSTGSANMSAGSWRTNGNFFVGDLGSGTLELSGGNLTVSIFQFHVGNEGDGTLQMSGGNLSTTNSFFGTEFGSSGNATLTGGTWINANNLSVGPGGSASLSISGNAVLEVGGTLSRGAVGSIDLAPGGTLQIGRGGATGTLDTDLVNNGHLIFNRTTASIYSGAISGTGMLTKNGSGTLTISGANTYNGTTTVNSGTLQLGNGGTTGSVPGPIINNSALAIFRSDDLTFSTEISGGGTLVKLGNNILTLASSVQGPVSVDSGTVRVNGPAGAVTVKSGATLAGTGTTGLVALATGASILPGDGGPGTLSTGGLSLAGGAIWNWEANSINGTAGVNSDLIESTGPLALDAGVENPVAFNISALGDFSLTGVKQASWVAGRFPGGISGFSAGAFAINTAGLVIPAGSAFTMALGEDNTLVLLFQTPQILPSVSSLGNFTATLGNASAAQSLTVNGTQLQGPITLTAPTNFEISTDNSTFASTLELNTITGDAFTLPATLYIRIAPNAPAGPVSGNLTLTNSGAETQSVALSGLVGSSGTPEISATPASLTGFTAALGTASAAQSFTLNGSNLTANITIGAPSGFEVSSTVGGEFSPSLSLVPVNGTLEPTSVYARLTATASAGANSGNLTLASTGAAALQIAVDGTVTLPYEDWVAYWNTQSGSFSGAAALGTADPDGDGYDNTTEFALGGDPLSPTASLISVASSGGNITVTFLARTANGTVWTGGNATGSGLDYQIQGTLGLLSEFQVANVAVELDSNQSGIPSADIPYQRWKFEAPITDDKHFYRVRAVPNIDN